MTATAPTALAARAPVTIAVAMLAAAITTAAFAAAARTPLAARAARFARCGSRGQLLFGRRGKERLARQADLAAVRLDADHLHLDFVADLHDVGHLPDARVRHLGDVQQAVLSGEDLHERSVRLDALDRSLVVGSDLRRRGEALDDLDGALRG